MAVAISTPRLDLTKERICALFLQRCCSWTNKPELVWKVLWNTQGQTKIQPQASFYAWAISSLPLWLFPWITSFLIIICIFTFLHSLSPTEIHLIPKETLQESSPSGSHHRKGLRATHVLAIELQEAQDSQRKTWPWYSKVLNQIDWLQCSSQSGLNSCWKGRHLYLPRGRMLVLCDPIWPCTRES